HRREPRAVRLDARCPAGSRSAHRARHRARPGRGRHLCHLLVVRAPSPDGGDRPAGCDGFRVRRRWCTPAAGAAADRRAPGQICIAGSLALCASTRGARPAAAAPTAHGIGLGLVAGATYATFSWSVHRLLTAGIARPAAMGSVFGAGGALLLPVLLLTGAPLVASAQNLVVAGYMALVPMFLGYVLFGIGLTTVPASTATTVTLTEPAVATVLAVVIVGERLGPAGWAGLCLIGLVLIVLALAPTNLAPAEPTAPGTPVRGTPSSARRHAPSTAPQR